MKQLDAPRFTPADAARADMLPHKTVECDVKMLDESGQFELYAAVFGNVDRAGDVIESGAFKNLDEFVRDGWGAVNHDRWALPVAMIESATQDGTGLKIAGRFHSTPQAQECRTIVRERKAAGKRVLCSIGYLVDPEGESYEKQGGKLVHHIKSLSVYEFSFVNVPANPRAEVISAKAHESTPEEKNMDKQVVIEAIKEVFGLDVKADEPDPKVPRSGLTRLKSFAEAMDEHGSATRTHAKAMHEHGKAASLMGKAMKDCIKAFGAAQRAADDAADEDEEDAEGADDDAAEEDAEEGKGKKSDRLRSQTPPPARTKTRDELATDVYRDSLRRRGLAGRRLDVCP